MRIISSTLTHADLSRAAAAAGAQVIQSDVIRTRRSQGFEVTLSGHARSRTQRFRDHRAATYRQWGVFLSALYAIDPTMHAGPYADADSFDAQTRGEFPAGSAWNMADDGAVPATVRKQHAVSPR